jgi:hypothetical protein
LGVVIHFWVPTQKIKNIYIQKNKKKQKNKINNNNNNNNNNNKYSEEIQKK